MILARVALMLLLAAPVSAQEVSQGTGAVLRGLDKVTGVVTDIDLSAGEGTTFGRLAISLTECRYPRGNPAGDAFAFVEIAQSNGDAVIFSGWMVASSPALNALDHARYDVWVLRCKTS